MVRLALLIVTLATPALALPPSEKPSPATLEAPSSHGALLRFGEDVRVDGRAEGDAVSYGGGLDVAGEVRGRAMSFGGDLIVRGKVHEDAIAYGGNVVLLPGARVNGRVTAVGGEVLRASSASVSGAVAAIGGSMHELTDPGAGTLRNAPMGSPRLARTAPQEWLLRFVLLFAVGFLAHLFAPARLHTMELELRGQPLRSTVVGMLALCLVFPASVLIGATGVGLPLAFALWFAVVVSVALGASAGLQALGRVLPGLRRKRQKVPVLAAGAALLALVGFLPWVDVVVYFALGAMGLGAAIVTRFGSNRPSLPVPIRG